MNGLFEVKGLKVFLYIFISLCVCLSLSKLSDIVLLRDPIGEGDNIQLHVGLNNMIQTLLEVWKSSFYSC